MQDTELRSALLNLASDVRRALVRFEDALAQPEPAQAKRGDEMLPETRALFEEFEFLAAPRTARDHEDANYAFQRATELEEKYPQASLEQIYTQIAAELRHRRSRAPQIQYVNGADHG